MGTAALTLVLCRFSGWYYIVLIIIMKSFLLSSLLSLSLAAPAPEAEAVAEAEPHVVLGHHVAPLAVVPAKQLQWPGVSAPGVDTTCFGCRQAVVVAVGRRRREAEAEAVAEAEATAEAEPVAEAAAAPLYPLSVAPFYPYHVPAVALHSSSYAAVNNAGVAYNTGVRAVHVLHAGRKRREAAAEAEAEADADAYYPYFTSVNGYAHNLLSGNSYASISSGLPYHAPAAFEYGYPYHYLG